MGGFGSMIVDSFTDPLGLSAGADAQEKAARQAAATQLKISREAREYFNRQANRGVGAIEDYGQQGADIVGAGGAQAREDLQRGMMGARNDLATGAQASLGELATGYDQARGDLGELQGLQQYGEGATTALQAGGRLGSMLDQQGGLYAGFEADPGYQFRQQQGEQAINRSAAAQGGRLGGATLKALADYNQGLASQEFANFAGRRQSEAGMAGNIDQQQLAAGMAAQNNQMGLAQLGYGSQNQLSQLAMQRGMMGSDIQNQLGQNLSGATERGASNMANNAFNTGSMMGNMYSNMGSNIANTYTGSAAQAGQMYQSDINSVGQAAQAAGMGAQARANTMMGLGAMAAMYFSDARLKTDVRDFKGTKWERLGLRGKRWRWNKTAEALGLSGEGYGVIAQEVAEKYPAAVDTRGGFLAVRYGMLDAMILGLF